MKNAIRFAKLLLVAIALAFGALLFGTVKSCAQTLETADRDNSEMQPAPDTVFGYGVLASSMACCAKQEQTETVLEGVGCCQITRIAAVRRPFITQFFLLTDDKWAVCPNRDVLLFMQIPTP